MELNSKEGLMIKSFVTGFISGVFTERNKSVILEAGKYLAKMGVEAVAAQTTKTVISRIDKGEKDGRNT